MGIVDEAVRAHFENKGLLLNRAESPTTASTQLNKKRLADGLPSFNLGQGAETESPDAVYSAIPPRTIDGRSFSHVYPKRGVGGEERVKAAAAGKINRYFGTSVTDQNVFVLPVQGRAALKTAITAQNGRTDDGRQLIAIPEYHWPMYDGMIKSARGSSAREYPNPDSSGEFKSDGFGYIDSMQAVVVNSQHNPTGKVYPVSWIEGFMSYVNGVNAGREDMGHSPIMVCFDMPYFHTLESNPNADLGNGGFYYEKAGLKEAMEAAGDTPFVAIVPGTKAWGTAEPGFSIVVMNDAAKKIMQPELMQSFGLAGMRPYFEYMADFLGPEYDPPLLQHEADLREKYRINVAALRQALSGLGGVRIVDGDPGMTSLLELDLEQIMGKRVHGEVTGDYDIEDMNDVVEFLALNYGVVTVNNGEKGGNGHLRLANALAPDTYVNGVRNLRSGLQDIVNAGPIPSFDASVHLADLQDGPG